LRIGLQKRAKRPLASNFWAWSGESEHIRQALFGKAGDDFFGIHRKSQQGLNSVFSTDYHLPKCD